MPVVVTGKNGSVMAIEIKDPQSAIRFAIGEAKKTGFSIRIYESFLGVASGQTIIKVVHSEKGEPTILEYNVTCRSVSEDYAVRTLAGED